MVEEETTNMQGTRGGTRWKPRCDLALCSCSTDRAAHGTDDGQPQWLLRAGEHRAWCSETQPLAMPLLPACAQPRREVVAVAATTLNGSSQGRRRASTRLRPTSDDRRGKRLALIQREHDLVPAPSLAWERPKLMAASRTTDARSSMSHASPTIGVGAGAPSPAGSPTP